jgi:hypothetical protein
MLAHVMLEQAWKTIDAPEKWCRYHRQIIITGGENEAPVVRCALGALDTCLHRGYVSDFLLDTYDDACRALMAVMPLDWQADDVGKGRFAGYCTIADYNNSRESWEEIRDWWQAAIEYARRQHNQPIVDALIQITVPETEKGNLERLPL